MNVYFEFFFQIVLNFERLLAGRIGSFTITALGLMTLTLILYRYTYDAHSVKYFVI